MKIILLCFILYSICLMILRGFNDIINFFKGCSMLLKIKKGKLRGVKLFNCNTKLRIDFFTTLIISFMLNGSLIYYLVTTTAILHTRLAFLYYAFIIVTVITLSVIIITILHAVFRSEIYITDEGMVSLLGVFSPPKYTLQIESHEITPGFERKYISATHNQKNLLYKYEIIDDYDEIRKILTAINMF
ncbi:MAG: hypothetical protein J6A58_11580 [Oscillospiraceae bacterium]|nr:hypothetical protein [Oscillospiraceae bacterium]